MEEETEEDSIAYFVRVLTRAVALGRPRQKRRWNRARVPGGQTSLFFVDGWLSQAGPNHFVEQYLAMVDEIEHKQRTPSVCAFSYWSARYRYLPRQTLPGARRLSGEMRDLLGRLGTRTRVIPVAYSVGGAITLIALGRLLDGKGPAWLKKRISLVVLVQPAIHGTPELLEFLSSPNPFFRNLPRIMADVGSTDGPHPKEARSVLGRLAGIGVPVVVLYRKTDPVAPYVLSADPRVWQCEVPHSGRAARRNDYLEHVRIRKDGSPVVYHATKASVSWLERPAEEGR